MTGGAEARASGRQQNDDDDKQQQAQQEEEQAEDEKQKPKRRLRGCFFLLGMGSIAFTTATQQSTDYFTRQYQGLQPMPVISLCYNSCYMVLMLVLLFTPDLWVDKRARMFWGFVLFIGSVIVPALVEGLLNELQSGAAVRYGFCAWAVGAACAGAADAVVASVVNCEASACDCDSYAALGRTTCSLLLVSLRCVTKAAMPSFTAAGGSLKSASAHVVITVALLLACVLVVQFALPRLVAQLEDAVGGEPVHVPPGLTFQQTLHTALTAYASGSAEAEQAAASLNAAGNLAAMHPGVDSVFGLPLFSVRPSATARGLSFHFSSGQHSIPQHSLPSTTAGLASKLQSQPTPCLQQQLQQSTLHRYVAEHASTFARRESHRHSMVKRAGSSSISSPEPPSWTGSACQPTLPRSRRLSEVFARPQRSKPLFTEPACSQGSRGSLTQRFSLRLSLRHSTQHSSTAEESQPQAASVQAHSSGGSACSSDLEDAVGQLEDQARHGSGRLTPGLSGRLTPAHSFKRSTSSYSSSHRQPAMLKADTLGYMSGIQEDADAITVMASEDLMHPSPFQSLQLSSASRLDSLDEGSVDLPLRDVLGVCWAIAQQSWLYVFIVFCAPLLTQQIKPIAAVRTRYAESLGAYYTQVLFFAQTVGALVGSQLVPVYFPLRNRRRLLVCLTGVLLLFIPVFLVVLFFESDNPAAFVPMIFVLFTHSGYLNSSAFCLASDKMESAPDDRRVLQMVMALTKSVSSVVGSCLAFVWPWIKL